MISFALPTHYQYITGVQATDYLYILKVFDAFGNFYCFAVAIVFYAYTIFTDQISFWNSESFFFLLNNLFQDCECTDTKPPSSCIATGRQLFDHFAVAFSPRHTSTGWHPWLLMFDRFAVGNICTF